MHAIAGLLKDHAVFTFHHVVRDLFTAVSRKAMHNLDVRGSGVEETAVFLESHGLRNVMVKL